MIWQTGGKPAKYLNHERNHAEIVLGLMKSDETRRWSHAVIDI